jgi:tetratricopeptide (TPR) repeat protein
VFVSHAGRDRAWAEWAAWHLRAAGYLVELDYTDWAAGTNFISRMHEALRCEVMLALLSPAYLESSRYTTPEWTARMAQLVHDDTVRLVPVRIADVTLDGLWRPLVTPDVFGLSADEAKEVLLRAVAGPQPLTSEPDYPDAPAPDTPTADQAPRLPESRPPVWNMPPRNRAFIGRDEMLVRLREQLTSGQRAVVQALHGWGGVGKTQLATEYAYRFAGEYDLVWWITSEQTELVGDQLAACAAACRAAPATADTPAAVAALHAWLRRSDRWLLIFDNATSRAEITGWLPDGDGHVIITSRDPHWAQVAQPIDVDVFTRTESVDLLTTHAPHLTAADADALGQALGDLPLAIAQAADLIAETKLTATDYLTTLDRHAAELFTDPPTRYPRPLAAAITLAADRLTAENPAAGQLLRLLACMAPEPVPLSLFRTATGVLPEPLATTAGSGIALDRTVARIARYGLARTTTDGPILHRLIQAILRDTPDHDTHRTTTDQLLVAARPADTTTPALWPRWMALMPHILAADPATTTNGRVRWLTVMAVWHLLFRGDAHAAMPLAEHLHTRWTAQHGPDDLNVLGITSALAYAHRILGRYERARRLDEDTLRRYRRIYGDDHLDTLASASNLATDLRRLGKPEQARHLAEDTLTRRRRVLGDDHPDTLMSASNFANDLADLGEYEQARRLDEDTLTRKRRVLGDDHPSTLRSAIGLAADLHRLGDYEQARRLAEDTLDSCRRVLGADHPDTLTSANNLAIDLRQLGEYEQARRLDEDTLTRRRRALGDDHPYTRASAINLARDLRRIGEHGQADRLEQEMARWHGNGEPT